MKLYTEDGTWDLVGNNTPIFFIRDPILVSNNSSTVSLNRAELPLAQEWTLAPLLQEGRRSLVVTEVQVGST